MIVVGAYNLPQRPILQSDFHFSFVNAFADSPWKCGINNSKAGRWIYSVPDGFPRLTGFRQKCPVRTDPLHCCNGSPIDADSIFSSPPVPRHRCPLAAVLQITPESPLVWSQREVVRECYDLCHHAFSSSLRST